MPLHNFLLDHKVVKLFLVDMPRCVCIVCLYLLYFRQIADCNFWDPFFLWIFQIFILYGDLYQLKVDVGMLTPCRIITVFNIPTSSFT